MKSWTRDEGKNSVWIFVYFCCVCAIEFILLMHAVLGRSVADVGAWTRRRTDVQQLRANEMYDAHMHGRNVSLPVLRCTLYTQWSIDPRHFACAQYTYIYTFRAIVAVLTTFNSHKKLSHAHRTHTHRRDSMWSINFIPKFEWRTACLEHSQILYICMKRRRR